MKRLLIFAALIPLSCFAQSATLSLAPQNPSPPGGYSPGAVVPMNVIKGGNATATGLQFTMTPTAGIANVNLAVGGAVTPGSKQLSCSPSAPFTCLLVGLNTATIPDGIVATAAVQLSATITSSPVAVTLSAPVETDAGGGNLPTTIGNPTVTLLIKNGCDVNGDGSVGSADLSAVVAQATQRSTSPTTDLNSDGATDVRDAQIVATATVGPAFTCNAH